MARDETRDIWFSVEDLCNAMTSGESDTTIYRHGDSYEFDEVRFSPHEHIAAIERQLADRDDAIRQLQEALNELRSENDGLCKSLRGICAELSSERSALDSCVRIGELATRALRLKS